MISEILMSILFIGFSLFFLSGCIYIIICGIRGYLEDAESFCLFVIVVGSIGVLWIAVLALKFFGL